ncbi:histidine kinase [Streptomyces sp. NPDC007861]|uniref:sensor histidine kinase n=1 Tax=Streptomyces sp. NPDC007861 TaxID=3154893 RepID=UPI0033F00A85
MTERKGWSERQKDALVTGIVMLVAFGDSWVKAPNGLLTGQSTAVVASVSLLVSALLWWRRRAPGVVAAAIMVGYVIAFTPAALAVAMYTVGEHYRRSMRTLVLFGTAGCLAGLLCLLAGAPGLDVRYSAFALALILGPLVVGYAVAIRRDLATEAQGRAEAVERERNLLVERAKVGERARIARELQDVVAHRVGNIMLTASALRIGQQAKDPALGDAAELIRGEGHQALEELREVLGVLTPGRRGDLEFSTAPQPDISQLGKLVDRAERYGQPVGLRIDGHPESVPAQVQRAVHRIVQEGLGNAAKHAPGAQVEVLVDCRPDGVEVQVTNGPPTESGDVGPAQSGGNGLIGIGERVQLLDGTFSAGPYDGGYRLDAFIPHRGPNTDTDDRPAG